MQFDTWIDTFITEKNIDTDQVLEVEGASGTNSIPVECLIDTMKQTSLLEKRQIKDMIVKIDFMNGSIIHYFTHLAKAIAI